MLLSPCILLLLFALTSSSPATAQSDFKEVGHFYIRNFGPEDYDGHGQNWAIAQTPNDLIYVANGDGVLEYDGVSWRLIPVSNRSPARSLAVSAEGNVFVGGIADLGYLAPDSQGRVSYVSLVDRIAPEDRPATDVWRIHETADGIYFRTNDRLLRWDGEEIKVWPADGRLWQTFTAEGVLYVQHEARGLLRMHQDRLLEIPKDFGFPPSRVYGPVPMGDGEYLFTTRQDGMFRCPLPQVRGATCTAFASDLTDRLIASRPYHGTRLPDGNLIIATTSGGAMLLDPTGRLLRIFDEAAGLRDRSVKTSFVDRQGGLWLGLNDGLARLDAVNPLSHWPKTPDLGGSVLDVARYRGVLHAATERGILRLMPGDEGAAPSFVPSPNTPKDCWALQPTPVGLLAGCDGGLYNLNRQKHIWSIGPAPILTLHRSQKDPNLLYLGFSGGLVRMRLRDGQWTDAQPIDVGDARVFTIAEDAQGRLWLGTGTHGVVRVADSIATPFSVAQGLPAGSTFTLTLAGRLAVLVKDAGLWRLDDEVTPSVLVPDTTFDPFLPQGSVSISRLTEDDRGRVWIAAGPDSGVARPSAKEGYMWSAAGLRQTPTKHLRTMHPEPDGPLWLGGPHGLIRYDTRRSFQTPEKFPVWIRRVTTNAGAVLYDGQPGDLSTEQPYRQNSLRFAFAAPRYDAPEDTRYRVRLDGLDEDWSTWIDETYKDYTQLWEGRYVFRVQARDIHGSISQEDRFAFRILPPWYRSLWAYTLYGLALVAVVSAYVRFNRKKLQRERAISARLREIDKLKDDFLASTSHELRTPLYGIIGLAESLIDGATDKLPEKIQTHLEMIAGSGRRLSQLVNDILDHSRIAHGSLELRRRPVDLRTLVDVVLTLQQQLVGDKDLELRNAVAADLPAADADEARLEQIFHNLVGNAVKFTEEGYVEISAEVSGKRLRVMVEDTGIGIAKEHQERIFDAFEQAESGVQRSFGGTGLGLTVTRELVELHGGEIRIESTLGEGSRFLFTLPVSDQAAEPGLTFDPALSRRLSSAMTDSAEVETEANRASDKGSTHAPSILVVDDEPVNLMVLSNHLTSDGYQVTTATGGPQALELMSENTFELVVLDIMMPKMAGYEVCRKLREQYPLEQLPVIFLTAKNQVPDLVAGLAAGGNDYLTKPIGKDELLARVRTHLELLEVHRQLAARNIELARFNYTVAHDLKNPLTTILNFLGLVRQDAASGHTERLESNFERLDLAAQKLRRMLDELFELSRVDVQINPLETDAFATLVDEALAQLAEPVVARGVQVVVAPQLPFVTGDRARLLEALRHLLANAIQYLGAEPSPRIEVGFRDAETRSNQPAALYIRDNGIGIDPRYHEKVFELFQRLDPQASEGTGIGLALVKRIIEFHGGRIWVESEGRGHGSTFFFTLPWAD